MSNIHWMTHHRGEPGQWGQACMCELQQNHTYEEWVQARAEVAAEPVDDDTTDGL